MARKVRDAQRHKNHEANAKPARQKIPHHGALLSPTKVAAAEVGCCTPRSSSNMAWRSSSRRRSKRWSSSPKPHRNFGWKATTRTMGPTIVNETCVDEIRAPLESLCHTQKWFPFGLNGLTAEPRGDAILRQLGILLRNGSVQIVRVHQSGSLNRRRLHRRNTPGSSLSPLELSGRACR